MFFSFLIYLFIFIISFYLYHTKYKKKKPRCITRNLWIIIIIFFLCIIMCLYVMLYILRFHCRLFYVVSVSSIPSSYVYCFFSPLILLLCFFFFWSHTHALCFLLCTYTIYMSCIAYIQRTQKNTFKSSHLFCILLTHTKVHLINS